MKSEIEQLVEERVAPEEIAYLKMVNRKFYLPDATGNGKGNVCFLYTKSYLDSFQLMGSKENFIRKNLYRRYYYTPYYKGVIGRKRYYIKAREERNTIYKNLYKRFPDIMPYRDMVIKENETMNLLFDMSKYLSIFFDVTGNLQPNRFIPAYWNFMKFIFSQVPSANYMNRFVLIDLSKYPLGKDLKENLRNPFFVLYYTAWKYPDQLAGVDLDFYFFYKLKSIKINPSKLQPGSHPMVRSLMRKLYSYVPKMASTIDAAMDDEKIDHTEKIENISGRLVDRITTTTVTDYDEDDVLDDIEVEIKKKVEAAVRKLDKVETISATPENVEKVAEEMINEDDTLLESIYQKNVKPLAPKSTASSARDAQLLKDQEKLKVGSMTVKELEAIKVSKIPLTTSDFSNVLSTTNQNMKQNTFVNWEKDYNQKVMKKDITSAILALNDKSLPMFVRDIKVEDTSDELNYKETYTIYLEDSNRKRHTIKVDIPKFLEDKFLYIGGNRKVIKKQSFFYPVVKTGPDEVQIVTNYNKMYIYRVSNKSLGSVERFKRILKKNDAIKKYFKFGNALLLNKEYITTLEYDDISKQVISFKSGKTQLFFSCAEAKEYQEKHNIKVPKNAMFIGTDHAGLPLFIDYDTQLTQDKNTIMDVILYALPEEVRLEYYNTGVPKTLVYAKAKVMQKYLPIGILLTFWEGLTKVLQKMGVPYRLEEKNPKALKTTEAVIKFQDTYLIYESIPKYDLILNGFKLLDTNKHPIAEYDTLEPYIPYLVKVYGKASIGNALLNTYEFIIDPITLEVIRDLSLPEDIVSLICYAITLLTDSQYRNEIDQHISRIRSNEVIPAILYERLAKNYILYRNSNGRKKYSVPQDCVIKELLALTTVEDYSTLNPFLELESTRGVSTKGFRGINLEDSYTPAKRSYDDSMIGIITASTPPDAQCGVAKMLSVEPNIKSLRGYVEVKDDGLEDLKDVNLFSPCEMSMPLGASIDDPNRLGHAITWLYVWSRINLSNCGKH